MVYVRLSVSLLVSLYGLKTIKSKKVPLFYRIACFGIFSYFLSAVYETVSAVTGFNSPNIVGGLGYTAMFLFLFSSYYGAMDSLVDDKSGRLRKYRIISLLFCLLNISGAVLFKAFELSNVFVAVSAFLSLYFSFKHLIIEDIEMGIVDSMRLYNLLIVLLCISFIYNIPDFVSLIIIVLMLPVLRRSVNRWFI
ncbi:MAG: hypothetical protein ACI4WM_01490 [Erysipelotrichaceae bacterium]